MAQPTIKEKCKAKTEATAMATMIPLPAPKSAAKEILCNEPPVDPVLV